MVKRRNRVYMPMGTGGLLRYPEEEETRIKLKPEHVVYLSLLVAIGVVFLRFVL